MYSDNALIRAIQQTKQDLLGTLWFQVTGLITAPPAGALVALLTPGNASPQTQGVFGTIAAFATLMVVVALKFFWNLHRAPYHQRDEARERTATLEKAMRPVLELIGDKEEVGKYPLDRGWDLVIHNMGVDKALGCSARIEAIDFKFTDVGQMLKRWPTDRQLHWAGQEGETYDIPGGQTAHLNIAYFGNISFPGQQINRRATLAYRGDETFRATHALPEGSSPMLVLINLVSDGQRPLYILCELDVAVMKDMILAGLSPERAPLKSLYFGPDRPALSDYRSESPAAGVFR
jgi:hypothetical protein